MRRSARWLIGAIAASQTADVVTTVVSLRRGLREGNPLLAAGLAINPAAAFAVKLLIAAAMILLALTLSRPRLALAAMLAVSLVGPVGNLVALA